MSKLRKAEPEKIYIRTIFDTSENKTTCTSTNGIKESITYYSFTECKNKNTKSMPKNYTFAASLKV
jgi:hypothetical protein